MRGVKTLPGADTDSSYDLLVAEVERNLKPIKDAEKKKLK